MLFSAPMVQAILREPEPKTQTRRIIKLKTGETFDEKALVGAIQEWRPVFDKVANRVVGRESVLIRCPYGLPGDTIWAKETYRLHSDLDPRRPSEAAGQAVWYEADNASLGHLKGPLWGKLRPSIHMPRSFSRIELEVTDVRVERLQDIGENEAMAEGVWIQGDHFRCGDYIGVSATGAYRMLWGSINGDESWRANPWVWAVTFRRTRPTKAVLASAR